MNNVMDAASWLSSYLATVKMTSAELVAAGFTFLFDGDKFHKIISSPKKRQIMLSFEMLVLW